MRRWIAGGAAVALAAGGGAVLLRDGDGGAAAAPPAPATAPVTYGDLVDTKTLDGTLTYAGERHVAVGTSGVVTAMPAPGRTLRQGDALYRVNRRPTVLMYGKVPLYRTLEPGISGPDVAQLERALRDLGHGGGLTVDRRFTAATARAVRDWQDDAGLPETGRIDAGQVVFLPGPMRVAKPGAAVGDTVASGRRALTLTTTARLVHVDLKASDQRLARRGAPVTVELPGGGTVRGRISAVGTVATAPKGDAEPTIDVEITLDGGAGRLDRAPVAVTVESDRRRRVLSVPVEALLALRAGGHGVEVVGPGGRRVVPVRTGAYGGGRVEIAGAGLRAGTRVGVPAT
ncbi:peptidoglycan-binding protein [Spirillospora sp. NPDC050679]